MGITLSPVSMSAGYRSILDAMKSFAVPSDPAAQRGQCSVDIEVSLPSCVQILSPPCRILVQGYVPGHTGPLPVGGRVRDLRVWSLDPLGTAPHPQLKWLHFIVLTLRQPLGLWLETLEKVC